MINTDTPGPAAQIRRLLLDAAASKVQARRVADRHQALGQMFGLVKALKVLQDAGIWDEGTTAAHGTSGDNLAYTDELTRFLGGADHARQLGFDIPERIAS